MSYDGYLTEHVGLIRDCHQRRLSTRATAELLFANGARADSSEPGVRLTPAHHIKNLRQMVLFVLNRLGLRERKRRGARVLNARPTRTAEGIVWQVCGAPQQSRNELAAVQPTAANEMCPSSPNSGPTPTACRYTETM
jgi:hypothetical protein